MDTATISTRLNKSTLKELEKLSLATKRSKAYLAAEAIEAYIHEQTWQIGAIKEGLHEADKDNFATTAETKRYLKKWGVNDG